MNTTLEMKYLPALATIRGLSLSPGYSLADTSKLLGTSEAAISKMFRTGKLIPLRTRKNRFAGVLAVDLERYLADTNAGKTDANQKRPGSEPPIGVNRDAGETSGAAVATGPTPSPSIAASPTRTLRSLPPSARRQHLAPEEEEF